MASRALASVIVSASSEVVVPGEMTVTRIRSVSCRSPSEMAPTANFVAQ
jgi:hypothetical protein